MESTETALQYESLIETIRAQLMTMYLLVSLLNYPSYFKACAYSLVVVKQYLCTQLALQYLPLVSFRVKVWL